MVVQTFVGKSVQLLGRKNVTLVSVYLIPSLHVFLNALACHLMHLSLQVVLEIVVSREDTWPSFILSES
jgi:hypothetical protein